MKTITEKFNEGKTNIRKVLNNSFEIQNDVYDSETGELTSKKSSIIVDIDSLINENRNLQAKIDTNNEILGILQNNEFDENGKK